MATRNDSTSPDAGLSRREREIMKILCRHGEATVRDVSERMPDGPGYNAVRVTLGILEKKRRVTHREDGRRYVYWPVVDVVRASRGAVRDILRTFFARRPSAAILTMLDEASAQLSSEELDEIEAWIRRNREESRRWRCRASGTRRLRHGSRTRCESTRTRGSRSWLAGAGRWCWCRRALRRGRRIGMWTSRGCVARVGGDG